MHLYNAQYCLTSVFCSRFVFLREGEDSVELRATAPPFLRRSPEGDFGTVHTGILSAGTQNTWPAVSSYTSRWSSKPNQLVTFSLHSVCHADDPDLKKKSLRWLTAFSWLTNAHQTKTGNQLNPANHLGDCFFQQECFTPFNSNIICCFERQF